jgi:hypothetical protein
MNEPQIDFHQACGGRCTEINRTREDQMFPDHRRGEEVEVRSYSVAQVSFPIPRGYQWSHHRRILAVGILRDIPTRSQGPIPHPYRPGWDMPGKFPKEAPTGGA